MTNLYSRVCLEKQARQKIPLCFRQIFGVFVSSLKIGSFASSVVKLRIFLALTKNPSRDRFVEEGEKRTTAWRDYFACILLQNYHFAFYLQEIVCTRQNLKEGGQLSAYILSIDRKNHERLLGYSCGKLRIFPAENKVP